jgi:hypothetical protein
MAGLSNRSGRYKGNYEEFNKTGPYPRLYLSRNDLFYLNEIINLINHRVSLYTDIQYLRRYLSNHLVAMRSAINRGYRTLSGTTLGELYEAYIDLLVVHNQTYSMLEDIPGKRLTNKLKEELEKIKPPTNPFELEMMLPFTKEDSELLVEFLKLDEISLRKLLKQYINIIDFSYKLLKTSYLKSLEEIEEIKEYLDAKEKIS